MGRAIRIFSTEKGKNLMDEEALAFLLAREDLRNMKVVVISVAGRARHGKSFLLNFILRYLKANGSPDWLEGGSETLEGFKWEHHFDAVTQGVLIWDEVFKMRTSSGQEVAVVLMDTQGVFDLGTTVKDSTSVFAFSVLNSSVQIYNLMKNLKGDDFTHLQLFTEYGRMLSKSDGNKAPFQKLTFLVRDWQYPDTAAYGSEGGKKVLKKVLETPLYNAEVEETKQHIKSCFETLDCFLMPHPGLQVATSPDFRGKISDIEPEFLKHLKEFVSLLLAPENLVPKKINGKEITLEDFCMYAQSYGRAMHGHKGLPSPKNLADATKEAQNLAVLGNALEVYSDHMREHLDSHGNSFTPWGEFDRVHRDSVTRAVASFRSAPKMGDKRLWTVVEKELVKEVEGDLQQRFRRVNDAEEQRYIQQTAIQQAQAERTELLRQLEQDGEKNQALMKQFEQMNERILAMETQLKQAVVAREKAYVEAANRGGNWLSRKLRIVGKIFDNLADLFS